MPAPHRGKWLVRNDPVEIKIACSADARNWGIPVGGHFFCQKGPRSLSASIVFQSGFLAQM